MSAKNVLLGTLASAAIAFSAPALANYHSGGGYASGVYLGIQGGYAHTNWDDNSEVLVQLGYANNKIDDGSYGLRGFLGYDFNANWAVEIGYLWINNAIDYDLGGYQPVVAEPPAAVAGIKDSIGATAIDAVVKMRVCLDCNFSAYAKLGIAYMEAKDVYTLKPALTLDKQKTDSSNTNFTFGAGFQYTVSPCFIVNLDWQHYRGNDEGNSWLADLNFFSLGMAYKFAV